MKSYQKEVVCKSCMSIGITHIDCICTYLKDYPTVTVEFEVCNCCGHMDDSQLPFTEFNRQQLGDDYFTEEILELELQARIKSFTYQIDSFRGGDQNVNKGESAVRVTCIETGKVVECSDHRSRYQNIEQAKRILNE